MPSVAVFQIIVNSPTPGVALFDGSQADGFLGNPIHLEALLLGALALSWAGPVGHPCAGVPWSCSLAVGLEFTFERLAPGRPGARSSCTRLYSYGIRRAGMFALLVGAGYGIAYAGGGSRPRLAGDARNRRDHLRPPAPIWHQGAHYVLHHPLLGAGPGQLRTAMDSTATLSFYQMFWLAGS